MFSVILCDSPVVKRWLQLIAMNEEMWTNVKVSEYRTPAELSLVWGVGSTKRGAIKWKTWMYWRNSLSHGSTTPE